MSERMSPVEIEDVLSSIRRLVSEDARPALRTAPAADREGGGEALPLVQATQTVAPVDEVAADALEGYAGSKEAVPGEAEAGAGGAEAPVARSVDAMGDPGADKLILTPALRIVPDPQPVAPTEVVAFHSVRQGRVGEVVDRLARGLAPQAEEWEPVSEPPQRFASDWSEESHEERASTEAASAAGEDEAPMAVDVEPAGEEVLSEVSRAFGEATGGEGGPQEGWSAEARIEEAGEPHWVADGQANGGADFGEAPDGPENADDVAALPAQDGADVADHSGFSEGEAAVLSDDLPDDLPDWARMEAEAMQEAGSDSRPESSGAAQAAHAAQAQDAGWADAAEAQIRRELEDETADGIFARFSADDHDERHFDEEMLRDLVRDIIREELQGALGERITRNVRKLVRAEIARALAVRDFE